MIDHDRALELAAASIDFGLAAADDAALTAHLAECATCRATVSGLRADAAALRSLEPVDAPATLRERILDTIEDASPPAVLVLPDRGRSRLFPAHIPRPAAFAAAAVIVVAVIGGTLWWRGAPASDGVAVVDPSSRPTTSTPAPVPSAGTSAEPSAVPAGEPRLARLTADDEVGGVVALDTSFQLAAVDGGSAAELADRVTVRPRIEFTQTVEPDGRVRLTPVEPLTEGIVYRFELTTPDGAVTDSWAFQARRPLRVVTTLPSDTQTDVPVDSGIEVTFDQDGVVGADEHFTIEPRAAGRFEQHGRVLSFVPDRLRERTIYTVTISRGVSVEGTGEALETDVRFRFETAGRGSPSQARSWFRFSNDLFESPTRDRPVIGLWWFDDDGGSRRPQKVRLDVFRFPDRDAAIEGFVGLRELPRWSQWNGLERLPTAGLTRVARVNAQLQEANGTLWTTLPERLRAGWYLIEQPNDRSPAQAILQVTDVTAYLAVSERRSVVWANDAATGKPLQATVATDGTSIGRTDAAGLLLVDSPAAWLPKALEGCIESCSPVVTVTTGRRSAFLPATGTLDGTFDFWGGGADARHWLLFDTDRLRYRRTDTVHAWGMVRERDTGAVPTNVEIRLVPQSDGNEVPVALVEARPRATGAFTASLDLDDVAEGGYRLDLTAGREVIASRYVEVDRIVKPAYQIDVVTGRRVYVAGDRIRVTATTRFFEGTPVPGVPVRFSGDVAGSATTDPSGTATIRGTARWDADTPREGRRDGEIMAWPARAEERADISGSHAFVVFPSHWLVEGDASIRGRRVRITGRAAELDRDRLERALANGGGWDVDPLGRGLSGKTVRARVIEQVPTRRQIGTSYDFVEKRVAPVYDYSERDRLIGTMRLRTDASGRFSGSIAIRNVRHTYRVELTITDPDGLRSTTTSYAYGGDAFDVVGRSPYLASSTAAPDDAASSAVVGVGERVDIRMFEPRADGSQRADPHLFFAAQGGIRVATVRSSDRFDTRFPDWGPPNVVYAAVRFTGTAYVVATPFTASFRTADRALKVGITTDRQRYAPHQSARLSITTTRADGAPISASVIIRAVDEKLFSIGAASEIDPLSSLYEHVGPGILAYYATHHQPTMLFEGGDTGGGDDGRPRDTVLFMAVDTDANGRASVEMVLPSDLTSWHVSASAVDGDLRAGGTTTLIPVGLPFFVDTSLAPEYLAADRPTIQIRGFGSGLRADSVVTFSVDSPTLGLHESGLSARAFQAATLTLPKLTTGTHRITITGQTGRGALLQRHVLTRSFAVVVSRLSRTRTTYVEPTSLVTPDGGGDVTDVIVADAGIGRVLPVLHELAGGGGARMEVALAADVAAALLAERFDDGAAALPTFFNRTSYQREDGGIAVVPYAASDLEASVIAALVAPERFDGEALRTYLRAIGDGPDETGERRNLALAGLAGMGDPVLSAVRAALARDLTIRERLVLAIGAARLGDAATARTVAADLTAVHGEEVGAQARLRVGEGRLDDTTASALMAMLLATYGDTRASSYHAYVAANADDARAFALHDAAYARWTIDRAVTTRARFAYILDGKRTEITLEPGGVIRLAVTKALRPGFSIEPIDGQIGVTAAWREAVDVAAVAVDPDIRISRVVRPKGVIGQGSLVTVELKVTFGPHAPLTCHRVVDLVPSGLVPITNFLGVDPDTGEPRRDAAAPESQAGQRVAFCAEPTSRRRSVTLRYVARVISIGSYRWEPALAESRTQADRGALVAAGTVRIR